jgi:hypothetical protein
MLPADSERLAGVSAVRVVSRRSSGSRASPSEVGGDQLVHDRQRLLWSIRFGAGAGVAAWVIAVLAGQAASGQLTASVTNQGAYLPYLAVAACCAAVVIYATRAERGFR